MSDIHNVKKTLRKHKIVNLLIDGNWYNQDDLKSAKKCFDSKKLSEYSNPDWVISVIALVIHNVKKMQGYVKKQGESFKLRKELPEGLNQISQLAELINEEKFSKKEVLNKITFQGPKTKIELNAVAIQYLKDIIINEWATEENRGHWDGLLNAISEPSYLGRQLHGAYYNTEKQNLTRLKNQVAYFAFEFLEAVAPNENRKVVGRILEALNFVTYTGDGPINSLISRGRAENN